MVHWAVGDAGGAQMKLTDALEQQGADQFAKLRRLVAGSLLDLHEDWAPKGYGRASAGNLSLDAVAAYVGQFLERRYDSRNPWESRMRAYIPDVLRAPHRRTGIRDRTGARTTMLVTWFAEGLEWSDQEQSHLRDLVTVCMKDLSSPPVPVQPPRSPVDDPTTSPTPTSPRTSTRTWDPLPDAWRAFYTSPEMAESRRVLQHEYERVVEPMLLRLVDDNLFSPAHGIDVELSSIEVGITNLLNVLEAVAWADRTGASDPSGVAATFQEWLDRWLCQDRYVALHHYIALRGYHDLTRRLALFTPDEAHANRRTVAVYGTLMAGEAHHDRLAGAVLLGRTTVSGRLHHLELATGEAARRQVHARASDPRQPPDSSIVVEVYRLPDNDFVLADIDGMADDADSDGVEFRRRLVRLPEDLSHPDLETASTAAWVFDYVLSDSPGVPIPSGDWHARARASGRVAS